MTATVRVSRHARRRIRARLGVPSRACQRLADRAYLLGRPAGHDGHVVYRGAVFLFGLANDGAVVLVTVKPLDTAASRFLRRRLGVYGDA